MSNPQVPCGISHISSKSTLNSLNPITPSIGQFLRQTSRQVAIESIALYQRYVSPHKGYHCAHRRFHGGLSCSEYVKQTIATVGLRRSLSLARQRFQACRMAHETIATIAMSRSFAADFSVEENKDGDDRPAERVNEGEYYAPPEQDPLPPTEDRWSSCCVCGAANACCGVPSEVAGCCGDPLEGCSVCWDGCNVGGCSFCF